jgi:hypothetical protein
MITPFNTQAFYLLYPQAVRTVHDVAYDIDGNEIEYALDAVEAKAIALKIAEEAKLQSAQEKLAKLGLTPEDLKALLG